MEEKIKYIQQTAQKIFRHSRNTLLVKMRFLDIALNKLKTVEYVGSFATNGKFLFYDPVHTIKLFKKDKNQCTRAYIHMLFHCVFKHMFANTNANKTLWNIACDIAVESVIAELDLHNTAKTII